ncbi:MAG: nucleotidyltransferase domain-containing protein [Spirochaetota bacterium]|nr:nucleotidyltransferase domain-containing protein [Spirochaetota bacterium]
MNRDEIISSLKSFKKLNKDKYSIIKIGLFGSAARDEMSEESDIDVVVELRKQDLFDLIGIKQDLEDQFHYQVDIVSYRSKMNKFLKRRIDNEAVYV